MPGFRLFILLLLLVLPLGLQAQLKVYPHERGALKKSTANARVRSTTPVTVDLPFWDDFSRPAEGTNPADSLWYDKSMVIVTSGLAIQPPSINVVTFDGLNAAGVPYNPAPGDEQVFGYRDTLVSQFILLDSTDLANTNQLDSVFLSFAFQAGGNGEPPDQADFLSLEFKGKKGGWHEAAVLTITDAPDPTKFYDKTIQIHDSLMYTEFQFRFISFGRKSGRYDTWHIDYVYLNDQRHANDSVPDRTLSQPLGPIFGRYYEMPIEHFFKDPNVTAASFYMRNLYKQTVVNYNTDIKSAKYYENVVAPTVHEKDLDVRKGMASPNIFPARSLAEVTMENLPDPGDPLLFDPSAERIKFTITVGVDSADNDFEADYKLKYAPIDFRFNDTLQVEYSLDSAYAYDDGTAEYSAGLVRAGNELAYRFENIHSGQDSILRAVLFYFPTFAGSTNASSIHFFVLNEVNGEPGEKIYEDFLPVERTTNNEVTWYEFREGVILDGPFYISYREPSTGSVRVGLDKSNNTGDQMYFRNNSTSNWILNDEVTGSLMIRPVFGPHNIDPVGLPEDLPAISVFPNPTRGEFYIQGPVSDVELMSATGEPVQVSKEMIDDRTKVSAFGNPMGVYILRYKTGKQVQTRKILFTR